MQSYASQEKIIYQISKIFDELGKYEFSYLLILKINSDKTKKYI